MSGSVNLRKTSTVTGLVFQEEELLTHTLVGTGGPVLDAQGRGEDVMKKQLSAG